MKKPLILVALDRTRGALAAMAVARSLGDATGGSVHMIHASREPIAPSRLAEQWVTPGATPADWSIDVRMGEAAAVVLDQARSMPATLIVLCTHEAVAAPGTVLGHTALDVLQGAQCPVALVPPAGAFDAWRPKRVMLPYDGSPAANSVVAPAVDLARCAGGELFVVEVGARGAERSIDSGSLTLPRYVDQPQHEWPRWSDEVLERLACACPDHQLRTHLFVRAGEPAAEVLRLAAEQAIDLIVLAWKGEWAGTHAQTLKSVIQAAVCPVLVVRAGEPAPAGNGMPA